MMSAMKPFVFTLLLTTGTCHAVAQKGGLRGSRSRTQDGKACPEGHLSILNSNTGLSKCIKECLPGQTLLYVPSANLRYCQGSATEAAGNGTESSSTTTSHWQSKAKDSKDEGSNPTGTGTKRSSTIDAFPGAHETIVVDSLGDPIVCPEGYDLYYDVYTSKPMCLKFSDGSKDPLDDPMVQMVTKEDQKDPLPIGTGTKRSSTIDTSPGSHETIGLDALGHGMVCPEGYVRLYDGCWERLPVKAKEPSDGSYDPLGDPMVHMVTKEDQKDPLPAGTGTKRSSTIDTQQAGAQETIGFHPGPGKCNDGYIFFFDGRVKPAGRAKCIKRGGEEHCKISPDSEYCQ